MSLSPSGALKRSVSSLCLTPSQIELERRLLACESVRHPEVYSEFENLAASALSPNARKVSERVTRFYLESLGHEAPLKERMQTILQIIAQVPFLESNIPAGQLFCDNYDPIARRYLALCCLCRAEIAEDTFTRRDLPDFDVMSILKPALTKTFKLTRDGDEELRCRLAALCRGWKGWPALLKELKESANVPAVKLTSALGERQGLVDAFMQEGGLALCMANPVPFQLWNGLPLLVADGDSRYLNTLRDFMIGLDELPNSASIQQDVPAVFRKNLLLTRLLHGSCGMDDWLEVVSQMVAATMPERPLHFAATGLKSYSARHWRTTVRVLVRQGLIEELPLRLTPSGFEKARQTLTERRAFLIRYGA